MPADVIANGLDQLLDVVERIAPQSPLGEVTKPAFDQVEPGTGRGSKVQVKARMAMQPMLDAGMLVRGVVVHDQVQVPFAGRLLIEAFQEADKFLMPVLRHAVTDHGAIERTQGREQSGGAVARVVVRHRAAAPRLQRQTRLGSVQGLNLALLIDAEHQRFVGRVEVKADHVGELFNEPRIATHLERRHPVGLQIVLLPNSAHGRFADALGFGHHPGAPVRGVRAVGGARWLRQSRRAFGR